MAATGRANELKKLQNRVTVLEKQLAALSDRVAGLPTPGRHWWETLDSAGASDAGFHQAMEDLRREIADERERDRAAIHAEMDRLEAEEAAAQRRAAGRKKTRRAG